MLRLMLPLLLIAAPANAHEGSHFHPHGIEPVWAVVLIAIAVAAGFVFGRGRK